jgi:ribosomal protein S27E
MKAKIIRYRGYHMPGTERGLYYYDLEAENGYIFFDIGISYYPVGTEFDYPDDMVQYDSGAFHWVCEACGHEQWTRTRPGGSATCNICGAVETIPEGAVPAEYEPMDDSYFMEDDYGDL